MADNQNTDFFDAPENAPAPLALPDLSHFGDGKNVNVVNLQGVGGTIPIEEAPRLLASGRYRLEAPEETKERELKQLYGNAPISAALLGGARSLTFGLSDVIAEQLGYGRDVSAIQDLNPLSSLGGEAVGAVAPALPGVGKLLSLTPAGLAMRAGTRVSEGLLARGATKALATGAGVGLEGAAQGFGQATSNLALSEDPVTAEAAFSELGLSTLLGGGLGLGIGSVAGFVGEKLANRAARKAATREAAEAAGDFSHLGPEALKKLEKEELELVGKQQKAAASEVASGLKAHRDQAEALLDMARSHGGLEVDGLESAVAHADRILKNVKAIERAPKAARDVLEEMAQASEEMGRYFRQGPIPPRLGQFLESNAALQKKAIFATEEAVSERLGNIRELLDKHAAKPANWFTEMAKDVIGWGVGGYAIGGALGAGAPFGLALFLGRQVAHAVEKVVENGGAARAVSGFAGRLTDGLDGWLNGQSAGRIVARPATTAILARGGEQEHGRKTDVELAKMRMHQLRSLGASAPMVAEYLHQGFEPLRNVDPILADRAQSTAMRAINFLAGHAQGDPGLGTEQNGYSSWEPSRTEARRFARLIDVVERPIETILDDLSDGTLSPEVVSALQAVYPGTYEAVREHVELRLRSLKRSLTWEQRLSLGTLLDIEVDSIQRGSFLASIKQSYAAPVQAEPPPARPTTKAAEPLTVGQRMAGANLE